MGVSLSELHERIRVMDHSRGHSPVLPGKPLARLHLQNKGLPENLFGIAARSLTEPPHIFCEIVLPLVIAGDAGGRCQGLGGGVKKCKTRDGPIPLWRRLSLCNVDHGPEGD